MASESKHGAAAHDAIKAGAFEVYKPVSETLGARGRNVAYHDWGKPKITNDGVTVAKKIKLSDPFKRIGAEVIKEVAEKTVNDAGDGTTTSIVLAYAMLEKGFELIKNGFNPMLLRKKVDHEVKRIFEALKEITVEIVNEEDLQNVATISVENPEHGKIIAHSIHEVGKDGLVIVEEESVPTAPGIRVEEVSGFRFERGWENPYLVTDAEKMQAIFPIKGETSPVPVLISDKQWNLIDDLLPLIEELKGKGIDKLLIIAEEVSGELLKFFVANRLKQIFHAVIVKPPFNKSMLEDIAALTGATALTQDKGIVHPKMSHLGYADKVIVTQYDTTIIGGHGDPTEKIGELRAQVEAEEIGYEKEKLAERLSKMVGKTIVLHVGAPTETEARYLKDKIDDAVGATRAASEEGVVAGGGMALFRVAQKLYTDDDEFSEMMLNVLTAPVDKILDNCGVKDKPDLYKKLSENEKSGYDALAGHYVENIVDKGIIDPAKVTRSAIKNAFSTVPMLLTTETLIAEMPENEKGNS